VHCHDKTHTVVPCNKNQWTVWKKPHSVPVAHYAPYINTTVVMVLQDICISEVLFTTKNSLFWWSYRELTKNVMFLFPSACCMNTRQWVFCFHFNSIISKCNCNVTNVRSGRGDTLASGFLATNRWWHRQGNVQTMSGEPVFYEVHPGCTSKICVSS
jgi:hypothetical protein